MTAPIELMPLKCVHCDTLLQAAEEEAAWACPQCGQGTQWATDGLAPLPIHWCASRPGPTPLHWLPFWVFTGSVNITQRRTFRGGNQPDPLWNAPRRFYIPAFTAPLEHIERLGAELIRTQPALTAGQASGKFNGCTLPPHEAFYAAEFVVINIEAERQDMLRSIEFTIENVSQPELWLLPFAGEPSLNTLAIAK